jgi:GNAT superfamily N-acetyltransferase
MTGESDVRIIEVDDERTPLAHAAIALIERSFARPDRHSADELRSELTEKRLRLIAPFDFHMLIACRADDLLGAALGVYLAGVNAGFVNYLAVAESHRGQGIGRLLRPELIVRFREDAVRAVQADLQWVLGEVRLTNPWMRRLVRNRGAYPLDLAYFHPGMRPESEPSPYVLYRQPVANTDVDLPAELVRRVLYAIYRRAYRVRYPLQHTGFLAMLEQLEDRVLVGLHPAFDYPDTIRTH